ncbi:RNA polymerase I associated factor, A49-like protein [Talaromyces proteolyticus]|uniref:RNA polymerase I associated factor, A49-like protein n=1 Tax=Talaromyces proteolyticus TaxID=1131652 RepID=A0AAD4KXY0_9EURO|nr:RNA polymerase I associated factor, A49-like protein [Talaromyces proteolyticus]KAH8702564.1 RNA polymerase I associated factor, A49-like protein [Talaromyces proteolyticus]
MASDKSEKKRKRDSDRHDRPSKKPALAPQNLPLLTASVLGDNSELAPVLVHTPGVQFPRKVQGFKPYFKARNVIELSTPSNRNQGIGSNELLLQSSEHPKLDFVGREADDDVDSMLNHYIAIVDPEKKTWQFVEVRKMTLRSIVRSSKRNGELEEDEEIGADADGTTTSYRAQRDALTAAFGTKASRKAAQSLAENSMLAPAGASNVAESAILSSMPSEAIASATTKDADMQAQIQANKPIPAANLAASHPSDVYTIDALVPGGLSTLHQLPVQEWQEEVEAGNAVTSTSRYVAHRIDAVVHSANTTHLQLLRFILVLLELGRCLKQGKKTDPHGSKRLPLRQDLKRLLSGGTSAEAQLPDPVIEAVRRKFAPQGFMSSTEVTLLHTTICALSLLIPPVPMKDSVFGGNAANELATDPADLRDDLRLDNTGITQYFRELGCRIDKPREKEYEKWGVKTKTEAAIKRICRLRIPLEFPRMSRGKASRR